MGTPAPLKRNWAKGRRLEFLESHLPDYLAALRQSRSRGAEYEDSVVNRYFALFHWRLGIEEEPPPGPPVDPNHPVAEELTEEEEQQKGVIISKMKRSIHNWLNYRTKKTDKSLVRRNDAQADPYALLLSKLSGLDQKPGKLLAGWQHWSKHNFEQHKNDFDEYFKTSGKGEKQRASARQTFIRDLFSQLSEEDQAYHNQAAIEERAAAHSALKEKQAAPPSDDPKDRQMAIDRLGSFLGPIIEGISNTLGMHVSVLIGGPEPRKGGQINVISMHHGVNKAAAPKNWGMADKVKYKAVTRSFVEYLETCYTKEEREARALPQVDAVDGTDFDTHDISVREDDAAGCDSSPDPETLRQKRAVKSKKSKKSKRSRNSKRRRIEKNSSSDNESSSQDESSSSADEDDEAVQPPVDTITIGRKRIRQLPFQAVPRNAQVQRPQSQPRPRPRKASTNRATPSGEDETITTPTNHITPSPREDDAVTTDPNPSAVDGMVIDTPTMSPGPPDGHAAVLGHSTSPVVLENSAWPVWFKNGYGALKVAKLGEKWDRLLVKYVEVEARANFVSPKGVKHALSADKRPAEVEGWIGRARKVQPEIKNIPRFEKSFWAWWKALQPRWREVGNVPGVLTDAHRQDDGCWAELNKPGQNGFLTVMSLLSWWGQALHGSNLEMAEWQAAADDVEWVLSQMLKVTDNA